MLKTNNWWLSFAILTGLIPACGNQETPVAKAPLLSESAQTDTLPPTLTVSKDYLLGKFDPATHPDFVVVGKPYSDKPGMMLRKEAFEAFQRMWEAARKDGITLRVISSTRTFEQQKNIWEGKWTRFAREAPAPLDRARKILEYSSMPGSSRHHWGTDIDLNDLNNPSFEAGGAYEKVYTWLVTHAHEYGFCQPYTPGRTHGYREEKWHWSYTPLSKPFLQQYQRTITNADIQGFQGAQLASEVGAVEHYVLGIGDACVAK
ncbi:MAG: M15 family metallopeptidase [Saprospiraceae bacterium]|nr:M15 family metallopeptidase [Saprospiraceae bacterium]